ncbi:MAG: STAS domain-containing protein [Ruminococcaceae bacterium]|nr:STAS domain-containing protein [Oscillospiraceae bacterium]
MEITTKCAERCLTIYLKGELDHHGAQGLIRQLEREIEISLPWKLILDFSGVTFMDSSGIAVAVRARQRVRELGGTIRLEKMAPQIRKVFHAAALDKLMEMD